jgi:PAS domain S-box-containing protein
MKTIKNYLPFFALFLLPLLFYPGVDKSGWRSSSDVHALLEFASAILAATAGIMVLLHFLTTGRRFFLIISIGFVQISTEELIHAIFSFNRIWSEIPPTFTLAISTTWLTGHFILLASFFIALFFGEREIVPAKRGLKAVVYNIFGLICAASIALAIFSSPFLPDFVQLGSITKKSIELSLALLFFACFLFYSNIYFKQQSRSPLLRSIIACIISLSLAHIFVLDASAFYDSHWDAAHLIVFLSYSFPIFGIWGETIKLHKSAQVQVIELGKEITERKRVEGALQESEDQFRSLFEYSNDAIFIHDDSGHMLNVNQRAVALLGYTREELLLRATTDYHPPEVLDGAMVAFRELMKSGHVRFESKFGKKDGSTIDVSLSVREVGIKVFQAIVSDITERKLAEEALHRSREEFKELFEDAPVGYHELDKKGNIVRVNDTELRMLGYTAEELLQQPVWTIMADQELSRLAVFAKLEGHVVPSQAFERVACRKDGSTLAVMIEDRVLRGEDGSIVGLRSVLQDITMRKLADEQLRRSLEEKEVLLREVHHRVKNNLNVISSLLNLQSLAIQTPEEALAAFRNSRDRIMSMALVHEELYNSRSHARVDMNEYVENLTRHLLQAYGSGDDIHLKAEAVGIVLGVDTAIPCGLILNELITNALKYAFPKGGAGDIHVLLRTVDDGFLELSVSDNGIGFSEGYETRGTLGLSLVQMLTEQLDGTLDFSTGNGTRCVIRFPKRRDRE